MIGGNRAYRNSSATSLPPLWDHSHSAREDPQRLAAHQWSSKSNGYSRPYGESPKPGQQNPKWQGET